MFNLQGPSSSQFFHDISPGIGQDFQFDVQETRGRKRAAEEAANSPDWKRPRVDGEIPYTPELATIPINSSPLECIHNREELLEYCTKQLRSLDNQCNVFRATQLAAGQSEGQVDCTLASFIHAVQAHIARVQADGEAILATYEQMKPLITTVMCGQTSSISLETMIKISWIRPLLENLPAVSVPEVAVDLSSLLFCGNSQLRVASVWMRVAASCFPYIGTPLFDEAFKASTL
jgi:hypothetical protein